jgi:carbonic anhydrase
LRSFSDARIPACRRSWSSIRDWETCSSSGHTQCGAVGATLEELRRPAPQQSPNLRSIVERIRPAVEPLFATPLAEHPEQLMQQAVRANIRAAAGQLRHASAILEGLIAREGLLIVGAEYSLETGVVEFFDAPPPA